MPHDGQTTGNSFRVRVRLKLEKKSVACVWTFIPVWKWMIWPWLLHPGSRWMPNVLISSEKGSGERTLLGHPELIECMGICVLNLAHESEQRSSEFHLHIVKKKCLECLGFFLDSARYESLDGICLDFCLLPPPQPPWWGRGGGGNFGHIIYTESLVF